MRRLRFWLWQWFGIGPDVCPWHGAALTRHGFPGHNERWTCNTPGCRFG